MAQHEEFLFQDAERIAHKLKIGFQGPAGSGKTKAALALATALAQWEHSRGRGNGQVCVIDTENESASLYSKAFPFKGIPGGFRPPYTSKRFMAAIAAAEAAGFGALVIDSMSHQWAGEGGILARKEAADARGGNSFTNWQPFTKEHEEFKAAILNARIHIIATLRSKTKYVMEEGRNGKQAPKKVGLEAVQREGMEYELSLNFEIGMDHLATATKDRTELFDGKDPFKLIDNERNVSLIAKPLIAYLESGKELAPEAPKPAATTERGETAAASMDKRGLGKADDNTPATLEECNQLAQLLDSDTLKPEERAKIKARFEKGEPSRKFVGAWVEEIRKRNAEALRKQVDGEENNGTGAVAAA